MSKSKEKDNHIDPEWGADFRYQSEEERIADSKALMEARLERMKKMPPEDKIWARLMQLKLQMDSYVRQEPDYADKTFIEFLTRYIDILYSKRNIFARDLGITPVTLSQVLNRHREPKASFLQRLMLHSSTVYKNVCKFPRETWYKVYYHEKIQEVFEEQEQWGPEQENFVTVSEPMEKYGKLLR